MKLVMKMPDLATTDSPIKVVRWLAEPGQSVQRGQILLEVETDKATMEVESIATGRLLTHHALPGETLTAGQPLASLDVEGPSRPPSSTPALPAPSAAAAPSSAMPPVAAPAAPPSKSGGLFARNRAAQRPPNHPA